MSWALWAAKIVTGAIGTFLLALVLALFWLASTAEDSCGCLPSARAHFELSSP